MTPGDDEKFHKWLSMPSPYFNLDADLISRTCQFESWLVNLRVDVICRFFFFFFLLLYCSINTLRPPIKQLIFSRHFRYMFVNNNHFVFIRISLSFYPAALKGSGYCRTPSGRAGGRTGGRAAGQTSPVNTLTSIIFHGSFSNLARTFIALRSRTSSIMEVLPH